jgi:membrane protein
MNATHALDSVKGAASGWVADRASSMGAALSYYTVFSIAPLLVIVIAVAGIVFGADAARGAIVEQLQGLLGDDAARTIQEVLTNVSEPKKSAVATAIGFLLLLAGATTVFAELQDDLNRIWKVPQRAKPKGAWGWIRARMLSFGMILAIGFLLLVSLVASAAISAVGQWSGGMFGAWETLAHGVEIVVSFGLLSALFAVMYRYLPDVRIAWHDVWVGAVATALLFTIGKFLIGLYLGKSSTASTYGAAGSLVVLLLWVYYSAQIFLFGAEFTAAYAHAYGSRRGQAATEAGAAPGVEPPRRPVPRPQRADVDAPLPADLPPTAVARHAAAAAARTPALLSPTPAAHGITAPIQRHPAGAIGLAAGLGAATALLLRRRQRTHAVSTRKAVAAAPAGRRRADRRAPPRAAAGVARAIASAVAAIATRAITERLKRGARRGWRAGKERAA